MNENRYGLVRVYCKSYCIELVIKIFIYQPTGCYCLKRIHTRDMCYRLVGAEREAREEAIVLLKDQLTSLRSDVASLEAAQAVLLGRMNECCKNDSALLLLIKKAVQNEMAVKKTFLT